MSLMRSTRILAAVAVGSLLATFAGSGVVHAAPSSLVFSDKASFVASGPMSGSFSFVGSKCILNSDGETPTFPCKLSGNVTKTSTGAMTGNATVASADGTIKFTFALVLQGKNVDGFKGKGVEYDTTNPVEPGGKYGCVVSMVWKFAPPSSSFTGSLLVQESSTAP